MITLGKWFVTHLAKRPAVVTLAALPLLTIALAAPAAHAQSLVVTGVTNTTANANLLADSLLGTGVTRVGNATLIGAANQQGTFTTSGGGTSGVIGFREGILLTSGLASNAVGPNNLTGQGSTTNSGSAAEFSGSLDANVLQFQFTVDSSTNSLGFSYVFASEEYPEFVNQFNDAFGIFVNGTNVAVLPTAGNPEVTINNVNANTNSQFYVSNTSSALNTQYDGLTTVLRTGNIAPLLNGGTNTLRIVIADRVDTSFDSGVFIQADSLAQAGAAAPEPGTIALLLSAGVPVVGLARRRKKH